MDFAGWNSDLPGTLERLNRTARIEQIEQILRESARRLIGAHGIALVLRDGDFCHYVDEDAIGPLWKGQKFQWPHLLAVGRC
jgi:hypothetical protein